MGFILINIIFFESFSKLLYGAYCLLGNMFLWQIYGFLLDGWNNVAWYLSAMIGGSVVIFPLLLWNRKIFINIIAPLLIFIIYGFMAYTYKNVGAVLDPVFGGVFHAGFIRGIAGLSMGCCLYYISQKIKKQRFTCFGKVFLTIVEVTGYAVTILVAIFEKEPFQIDFILIPLLAASICVSFSEKSLLFIHLQKGVISALGVFSLNIFLNHNYIAYTIKMEASSLNHGIALLIYIVATCICSLLNYVFTNNMTCLIKKMKDVLVDKS